MKRILGYFFEGLLLFVPVTAIIYVFYSVFRRVDRMVGIDIPGVGFAITMVGIFLLGFIVTKIVAKSTVYYLEKLLDRIPVLKLFYTAVRDLAGAIVGRKKGFDRPVLVSSPDGGPKILGFMTRDDLAFLGLADHVAVYVPQSYSFAGNVFLYPRAAVESLDATPDQMMAFVVSGGVSAPPPTPAPTPTPPPEA